MAFLELYVCQSQSILGDFQGGICLRFFMEWIVDWIQAISFVAIGSELRVKL